MSSAHGPLLLVVGVTLEHVSFLVPVATVVATIVTVPVLVVVPVLVAHAPVLVKPVHCPGEGVIVHGPCKCHQG